jgi:arylsulfatase A
MKKNIKFYVMTILVFCFVFCQFSQNFSQNISGAENKERPNIILIMADDFGYECVGANGGTSYKTPNLDKLAASGIRFENCFVQPLCTPTRTQLMTGKYNVRNYTSFGKLDPSQKTFGNFFRDAGYVTGIFGKWQLGREKDLPKHFGFDTYTLWQHTRRPPRYVNPGLEIQGNEVNLTNGEYGPQIFIEHVLKFIETNKDKPFFLYYPMCLTHAPFQPTLDSPDWDPKRTGEEYSDKKHFKEMTEFVDKNVGRIVEKLAATGLTEKTLIIFLGDNGTGRPITSQFKGKSYQGGKGSTTRAGMHVPLIVSFTGKIKAGEVNTNLVDSTDFLPTIADAAGIELPQDAERDGISFYPQLIGEKSKPREWIYSWFLGTRLAGQESVFSFDKQFKLYRQGEFFDLVQDPEEKNPLNPDSLNETQKTAKQKLLSVLNRYENTRPDWVKPLEKKIETDKDKKRERRKNKSVSQNL